MYMCVLNIYVNRSLQWFFIMIKSNHMIIGAEKPCELPSASWRPKEASGLIQAKSQGHRTKSTSVWEQEKMGALAQAEGKFTLPLPFCSI